MPISSRTVILSTIILLGVGLASLLGIVAMTSWLGERAQIVFATIVEARDTRTAAVELRSALQTAESSQRGYIVTGNEIYLAPYDAAKAAAERQLDVLKRALAADDASQPMLGRLTQVVGEKLREMDQSVALAREGRQEEVMALLHTNRGKALMDEANVFLSGVVRVADARLTDGGREQRVNASLLRWVSIVGGIVIVAVVGGAVATTLRYARELVHARDETRALARDLEARVDRRTIDLARARDRAEALLAEVNHRVANSLAMVAALVKLQGNGLRDPAARRALEETHARIFAISLVHKRLYSSGDVHVVQLDGYLSSLLEHLETSMSAEGHGGAVLRHELEPLVMSTDASINLGVVVTEWVTNAFKYAYPAGRGAVRVRLARLADGRGELVVEDDGVGHDPGAEAKGTGLGTRLVQAIATGMQADIDYRNRKPGTTARLVFPLPDA